MVNILEFRIRRANLNDKNFIQKAVCDLIQELRDVDTEVVIDGIEKAYDITLDDLDNNVVFIAENQENTPMGIITLSIQSALHCGGKYGLIQELWVKSDYRKLGIAKLLLKEAENYCVENKFRCLDVCLPDYSFPGYKNTFKFYDDNGYKDAGIRKKKLLTL